MEYTLTKPHGDRPRPPQTGKARKGARQGWAEGLRKMYDDVVSEPLPDSFSDLLKKLDRADDA